MHPTPPSRPRRFRSLFARNRQVWLLSAISAWLSAGPALATPASAPPRATMAVIVEDSIPEETRRQIEALLEDKRLRSPTQRKIDSQLLYAQRLRLGLPAAPDVPALEVDLDLDAEDRVLVDIDATVDDPFLAALDHAGGFVTFASTELGAVRAWLRWESIESLAARPEIQFIRAAVRATTNVGTLTSQGDVTHRADIARATYGVTGAGVKVGVISDSVDHLEASQASGDLGTVTILPGQSGLGQNNSGEGTAMLEIVHDLAPDAALHFASAFNGPASFAQNIRDLRFKSGCDIIVDDVLYFNESPFQDGVIAQAANDVTANGALFFSSAANSGNKSDGQSGTWEGDFLDSGKTFTVDNEQKPAHAFGSNPYNTAASGGSSGRIDLFWADPLGGSANDYDVFVTSSSGTVVGAGTNPQTGTHDPYESVNKLEVGQRVYVVKYSGAARYLYLGTGRGRLTVSTAGNTRGHACAADAFGVAAVDVSTSYPQPFTGNQKNPVEKFSSDGPRRVFFHANGTAVTPGNFSSTGGVVRQKPDIAAADGGRTTVPGFDPFFGTSAAAPHAGAIAALIKSYNPSLTTAQIRSILTTTALDIEAPGIDRDSGYGLIMADLALQATPSPEQPTLTAISPTQGPVGTAVTLTGTKLNGATGVQFGGTSATFAIQSASRITATVPAGAVTGRITVTTPSGTATSPTNFTVQATPAITGFSPASGGAGTIVTITGANLTGATSVLFHTNNAPGFTVQSPTQITVPVPAAATTGRIRVTTPSGTAESATTFTVTPAPVVTTFSPNTGAPGMTVTIDGANLTGVTAVRFNGLNAASFSTVSASRLTAVVPAGASTGPLAVATPSGTTTTTSPFTVVATPTLTELLPQTAPAGATILLRGTHLTGATRVAFTGADATFAVDSAAQISATVPLGAATGPVRVTTPGGTASSTGAFTIVAPPANDPFANAQTLTGPSGSATGNNLGATKESGEPDHVGNPGGKSVWYQWTAPSAGVWQFDTIGSTPDTLLGIYTGNTVNTLTLVARSDDAPGRTNNSLLTFVATAATTYRIAVDGYRSPGATAAEAAGGDVKLNWALTTTMPALTGFQPASGEAGTTVTLTGANFTGLTAVLFSGTPAAFTVTSASQVTATVPAGANSGFIQIVGPGGSALSATPFTVVVPIPNDAFTQATVLTGTSGQVAGSNTGATAESGEPLHAQKTGGRSVWFRWIAPASGMWTFDTAGSSFDTLLAIYLGNTVSALTTVAANDDASPGPTSRVNWTVTAGTEYRIALDGANAASGNWILSWAFTPQLPVVTSFTPSAGPVGSTVTITGSRFTGATTVQFNGVPAGFTVNADTQCTAVVPVGANTGPLSLSTPQGVGASTTAFTVTLGPANDAFASPEILSHTADLLDRSTVGASTESGEPEHADSPGGRSVWFSWTAPGAGTWRFDTAGSTFDTTLAVYTGTALGSLVVITNNDDARFDLTSAVFVTATAGTTYRIAVDGYDGDSGRLQLKYHPAVAPQELYSTGFETSDGFSTGQPLDASGLWDSYGSGGSGVLYDVFIDGGQQAFIGYYEPDWGDDMLAVWPTVNHTPNLASRPVVKFSVLMAIVDSENYAWDDFHWEAYNTAGKRLFALDFDNYLMDIYYVLDDGQYHDSNFRPDAADFENETIYLLEVTMDFARNRWSATLDGEPLVTELPITTTGLDLTLGDLDAVWVPYDSFWAGDNFMLFDDYALFACASDTPKIERPPANTSVTTGTSTVLSAVVSGGEPLTYQWQFNGVDIPGATSALLLLEYVSPGQAGTYTLTVTNTAGSATASATVAVNQPVPSSLSAQWRTLEGGAEFRLHGTPGARYRIEVSSDLLHWQELSATILPNSGEQSFSDPSAGIEACRYYRAFSDP